MRGKCEIGWSGKGLYNSSVKSISNILHVYNSRSIPTYAIFITFVGWLDDITFGTIKLSPIPIESLLSIKISCNNTHYTRVF